LAIDDNFCGYTDEPSLAVDRRATAVAMDESGVSFDPIPHGVLAFDRSRVNCYGRSTLFGIADDHQVIQFFDGARISYLNCR
jgi:hypothetical protein